jgi:hypothetical protein
MIPRFSGRPGHPPAGGQPDKQEAAEIFRRFFHVLERLDSGALRAFVEAMTPGAPETKAEPGTRRKPGVRKLGVRKPRPVAGRAPE